MIPPNFDYSGGLDLGIPVEALDRAVQELNRLGSVRAFPLLTLGHLAHESGASYRYLREVVSRTRDPYRSIDIAKKSGGIRGISAPEPILLDVQRWILRHLLRECDPHPASYAYRKDASIVSCASQHLKSKWMIKMDLHDFFGTIDERQVYRVFHDLGYSPLLAFELARIATRAQGAKYGFLAATKYSIPGYATDIVGTLPQGAPTSGMLANLVARPLDNSLQSLASQWNLVYTRYSDDLVFSSRDDIGRDDAHAFTKLAAMEILSNGLFPHRKKTRIVAPGARKIVLGLLVDESVRLLPEHRRRIEVHLRGCEQNGLPAHASHRGFSSVFSFVNHIDGWIAFAASVEQNRAVVWRKKLDSILAHEGLLPLGSWD